MALPAKLDFGQVSANRLNPTKIEPSASSQGIFTAYPKTTPPPIDHNPI